MAGRVHVRLEGTMGVGNPEAWSVGLNYGAAGGSGQGDQATVQQLAEDMALYLFPTANAPAAFAEMGADVELTRVSVYGYNGTGPASAAGQALLSTPREGAGSTSKPFQVTRCISLQTGLPGARYRGRIYVPALSAAISGSGKSTPPAGYLTAWKSIMGQVELEWAGSAPISLGVYSAAADVVTPVTQLRVGDVLDTQRRRRDALVESYTILGY